MRQLAYSCDHTVYLEPILGSSSDHNNSRPNDKNPLSHRPNFSEVPHPQMNGGQEIRVISENQNDESSLTLWLDCLRQSVFLSVK